MTELAYPMTILTTQGHAVFLSEPIPISPMLERESKHGGLTPRPAGSALDLALPLTTSPAQSLGQDQDQGANQNQSQSQEELDRSLGGLGRLEGGEGTAAERERETTFPAGTISKPIMTFQPSASNWYDCGVKM